MSCIVALPGRSSLTLYKTLIGEGPWACIQLKSTTYSPCSAPTVLCVPTFEIGDAAAILI
jgi:hypothetical protein